MRQNQNDNETTAQYAADTTAHQNMCCNQNDNETTAQHAADATAHQNMC